MISLEEYIEDLKYRCINRAVEPCYLINEIGVHLELINDQLNEYFEIKSNDFEQLGNEITKKTGKKLGGIGAWAGQYKERNNAAHHTVKRHSYTQSRAKKTGDLHADYVKELCQILGEEFTSGLINADMSSVSSRQHSGFKQFFYEIINHKPLWFVEVCIDTALSMILTDLHPMFLENIEKAKSEEDHGTLVKCFDQLLKHIKALSSDSTHLSRVYNFATSLFSIIQQMSEQEHHKHIMNALKKWIKETEELYQAPKTEINDQVQSVPNVLQIEIDEVGGKYNISSLKLLPEGKFHRLNKSINEMRDTGKIKIGESLSAEELDSLVDLVWKEVIPPAYGNTKDWIISFALSDVSELEEFPTLMKTLKDFVVTRMNRQSRNKLSLEGKPLKSPLCDPSNLGIAHDIDDIDDCFDTYSRDRYKALSLNLDELSLLEEDLEEIFEDHLCDYPLVILTSGICLETKTKYYGKFFKKQSEQALNKLLLKLKKKHRKADKSYVIWHEYKLESNAEPL